MSIESGLPHVVEHYSAACMHDVATCIMSLVNIVILDIPSKVRTLWLAGIESSPDQSPAGRFQICRLAVSSGALTQHEASDSLRPSRLPVLTVQI